MERTLGKFLTTVWPRYGLLESPEVKSIYKSPIKSNRQITNPALDRDLCQYARFIIDY